MSKPHHLYSAILTVAVVLFVGCDSPEPTQSSEPAPPVNSEIEHADTVEADEASTPIEEIVYPEYIPFEDSFTEARVAQLDSIRYIDVDGLEEYNCNPNEHIEKDNRPTLKETYYYDGFRLIKVHLEGVEIEYTLYYSDSDLTKNPTLYLIESEEVAPVDGTTNLYTKIKKYFVHNDRLLALFVQDIKVTNQLILAKEEVEVVSRFVPKMNRVVFYDVPDFSGVYEYPPTEEYEFTLTVNQEGNVISGEYCGYTTSRVDCSVPQQSDHICAIYGEVLNNGVAEIHYNGCYTSGTGEATLSMEGDQLRIIITKGLNGFSAVPGNALLNRKD